MKRYVLIALIVVMSATAKALPADSLVQFVPSTIGPYCPTKLLGGDREFGGHGPEIWAWVKIKIVNKINIVAEVYMHARETVSDWSETEGTWTKVLYRVPEGYEIASIVTGSYSEVHYVSRPGVNAFSPQGLVTAIGGQKGVDVPFKDDGLVARWNIVGDTGGDDISTDDNPNDDTQVAIQLNPVKLYLRRLPAKPAPAKGAPTSSGTIPVLIPVTTTNVSAVIRKDSLIQHLPATIGPYCPTRVMGGDREFGGHGPEIWAWVKLRVVNKTEIYADVYMHARETVSDWSETEGTWSKLLFTVPRGYEITEVTSGMYSEVHYVSKPGVNAFSPLGLVTALGGQKGSDVPFKDDGLVSRWNIVGDTGGTDISDDSNCNDDTQVAIQLNPMKIKVRRK